MSEAAEDGGEHLEEAEEPGDRLVLGQQVGVLLQLQSADPVVVLPLGEALAHDEGHGARVGRQGRVDADGHGALDVLEALGVRRVGRHVAVLLLLPRLRKHVLRAFQRLHLRHLRDRVQLAV